MRSAGWMRRAVWSMGLGGVGLAIACVPTRGGWDIEALRGAVPPIAALDGERLGDMVPFPALALADDARDDASPSARVSETERVALVACRFATGAPIRVRTTGPGWSEAAGAKALAALAAQVEAFGLALTRVDSGSAEILIEAFESEGPEMPEGLGDALVECDVARRSGSADDARVRGQIRRAEVRLRRSGRDAAGRLKIASDEAWTGALLHELGHALGYAGHAAAGDSILVRDESKLRGIGRDVLRGEPLDDATLAALHQLEPGRQLGVRRLRELDADWVRAVRALDRRWIAGGKARVAVSASVGDREARWSLHYADGRRLGLRFPGWPARLREGREILVFPDRETLAAIESVLRTGRSLEAVTP